MAIFLSNHFSLNYVPKPCLLRVSEITFEQVRNALTSNGEVYAFGNAPKIEDINLTKIEPPIKLNYGDILIVHQMIDYDANERTFIMVEIFHL